MCIYNITIWKVSIYNQLQTVPHVINSIYDGMVTNQQIFNIKAHQNKQDNGIAKFNTDQIKQVIDNNNYLKQQVTTLQQQVVSMHNQLTENTADIVD